MTCAHKEVERSDLEVYQTKYRVDPTTGNFEIQVFRPEYIEDLYDAPSVYTCLACGAETENYDELTGEWDG